MRRDGRQTNAHVADATGGGGVIRINYLTVRGQAAGTNGVGSRIRRTNARPADEKILKRAAKIRCRAGYNIRTGKTVTGQRRRQDRLAEDITCRVRHHR